MRWALLVVVLLFLGDALPAQVPARKDGALVEQRACAPNPTTTYDQYVAASKQQYAEEVEAAKEEGLTLQTPLTYSSRQEWERVNDPAAIDCRRITYLSDGLKVVGFIWSPKAQKSGPLPLIIFNRGGNREFGKLTPWQSVRRFALQGFVVIASQYRGNDGGEGQEEYGGADVRDVLNLVPLASSLGNIDAKNIFMLGWSRGGMMAYLALKNHIPVNAAAVGGGQVDLVSEGKKRPALIADVWRELIPGFDKRAEESMRERSAVYWADRIDVPILILHGGADWRVSPDEALAIAQKLQAAGKTYELVIYAGDDHGLSMNRADSDRRIVEWFRAHMK